MSTTAKQRTKFYTFLAAGGGGGLLTKGPSNLSVSDSFEIAELRLSSGTSNSSELLDISSVGGSLYK